MAILPSGWLLKRSGLSSILPALDAYSPATIIAQYLIQESVASLPPASPWPVFVSIQPDEPVNVLSTFDSDGLLDGRYMRSKKVIKHRGVQVRVRGSSYPVGYAKALQIEALLQQTKRSSVYLTDATWRLDNISQTSDILSIGQEPDTRRDVFVINTRCSLTLL